MKLLCTAVITLLRVSEYPLLESVKISLEFLPGKLFPDYVPVFLYVHNLSSVSFIPLRFQLSGSRGFQSLPPYFLTPAKSIQLVLRLLQLSTFWSP